MVVTVQFSGISMELQLACAESGNAMVISVKMKCKNFD
jgi:hypothetical protein